MYLCQLAQIYSYGFLLFSVLYTLEAAAQRRGVLRKRIFLKIFAKITVKIPVKKDTGTGVGKFCEIFQNSPFTEKL